MLICLFEVFNEAVYIRGKYATDVKGNHATAGTHVSGKGTKRGKACKPQVVLSG